MKFKLANKMNLSRKHALIIIAANLETNRKRLLIKYKISISEMGKRKYDKSNQQ